MRELWLVVQYFLASSLSLPFLAEYIDPGGSRLDTPRTILPKMSGTLHLYRVFFFFWLVFVVPKKSL